MGRVHVFYRLFPDVSILVLKHGGVLVDFLWRTRLFLHFVQLALRELDPLEIWVGCGVFLFRAFVELGGLLLAEWLFLVFLRFWLPTALFRRELASGENLEDLIEIGHILAEHEGPVAEFIDCDQLAVL